jgi:hypothetical protein
LFEVAIAGRDDSNINPHSPTFAAQPLDFLVLQLESLAAQIHLALILMKVPNEIAVEKPFVPATAADREATLSKFTEWMRDHGWSVAVTSSGPLRRKLRIRRRVLSLLRRKPSAEEILARGRWTARAYGALCSTEHDVPLYVARGARPSNFVVSLDW